MYRRAFLTGLLATPAIVAVDSLMPLRGIKYDPMMHVRSWPFNSHMVGEWWMHTGPLSRIAEVERAMREMFGQCYTKIHEYPSFAVENDRFGIRPEITKPDKPDISETDFRRWLREVQPRVQQRRDEYFDWYRPHHEANTELLVTELDKIAKWGA